MTEFLLHIFALLKTFVFRFMAGFPGLHHCIILCFLPFLRSAFFRSFFRWNFSSHFFNSSFGRVPWSHGSVEIQLCRLDRDEKWDKKPQNKKATGRARRMKCLLRRRAIFNGHASGHIPPKSGAAYCSHLFLENTASTSVETSLQSWILPISSWYGYTISHKYVHIAYTDAAYKQRSFAIASDEKGDSRSIIQLCPIVSARPFKIFRFISRVSRKTSVTHYSHCSTLIFLTNRTSETRRSLYRDLKSYAHFNFLRNWFRRTGVL